MKATRTPSRITRITRSARAHRRAALRNTLTPHRLVLMASLGLAGAGCMDIDSLDDPQAGESMAAEAVASATYAIGEESQCGPTLDFQDVEQYDGTYGVSIDFVDRKQAAVGQIQWRDDLAARYDNPGNVNGARWCSGTLIARDLFLTAGHCFDPDVNNWTFPRQNGTNIPIQPEQAALEMQVNFNYQEDAGGVLHTEHSVAVTDLVEYRLGGHDFAIIRLADSPGDVYGVAPLRYQVSNGDQLAIIGHPSGTPKKVSGGTLQSQTGSKLYYGDLDTLGGNSGSGILHADSGAVVGVHTHGGCDQFGGGANSGVPLSAIYPLSATLQALERDDWSFAWAQNTTGTYVADSNYARNSSGDGAGLGVDTTITKLGDGRYRVDVANLGDVIGGNVQVAAHGAGNARCKVRSWSASGTTRRIYVDCYSAGGVLSDSRFVVSYVRKGAPNGFATGAYLWSSSTWLPSFTPTPLYQWNSSGALNRVERTGTGQYLAILPGQAPAPRGGTVQVTAYGSNSNHCKVESWGPSGSDMRVRVRCFDAGGALADSLFNLYYSPTWAAGAYSGGHAWANEATSASYHPSDYWEYMEIAGDGPLASHVSVSRSGTGQYAVTYPGLAATGSTALVTAYGTGSEYCKVQGWWGTSSNTTVLVSCYDASGAPADTRYVSGYATTQVVVP